MSAVDIVVPCYNDGRFLKGCVGSILQQQGVDLRVVIIDDASSDQSPMVGRELAACDRRISFRRNETNAGHIATYNEGIEWAQADFWMLISDDDILASGALARALRIVERDSRIGLVGGADVAFCSSDEIKGLDQLAIDRDSYEIFSGREFILRSCQTASNLISTPTAFVRLSLVRQNGGYRNELPYTAEMELQLQIAARSRVGISESVQAFKRIHAGSMELQYSPIELVDTKGGKAAFGQFFKSSGELLGDESAEMEMIADQRLALDVF